MIEALIAVGYAAGFVLMSRIIRATSPNGYDRGAALIGCALWPAALAFLLCAGLLLLLLDVLGLDGKPTGSKGN